MRRRRLGVFRGWPAGLSGIPDVVVVASGQLPLRDSWKSSALWTGKPNALAIASGKVGAALLETLETNTPTRKGPSRFCLAPHPHSPHDHAVSYLPGHLPSSECAAQLIPVAVVAIDPSSGGFGLWRDGHRNPKGPAHSVRMRSVDDWPLASIQTKTSGGKPVSISVA